LRILQLIDSLHAGGAERMCVNISNVLQAKGYEVILCATRGGGPLENAIIHGVKCFILYKKNSFDFFTFIRLLRLVKENGIEVIHAHSSSVFWAIAVKIRLPEIKIIWHDHLGLRIKDREKVFLYKLVSHKIDSIISVNKELYEWAGRNMKVLPENVLMINNFPLLNQVKRCPNSGYFTLVCLANLRPQKDHGTLIKAVALLVKQNLPKKLKVILAGSVDQSEYSNSIRALVKELNLQDIVEIPGPVEDTASLLASADCGVLSSVSEGLPVALLEYGMAGLPVVVTDVGECAEVIGQGKYGHVVPPGNYEVFADKLKVLVENQAEGENIGKMFRAHILSEYGPEHFMDKYRYILTRLRNK